jgi:hypothetical protein
MSFKLVTALKTAWKDLKSTLTKVDAYLQANEPKIQAEIQTGVGVAEALAPSATPIITSLDTIEESAVSELAAAIHSGAAVVNASDGTAAVNLSAGLYSSVKSLVATLSNHPAVVAAQTAPATPATGK